MATLGSLHKFDDYASPTAFDILAVVGEYIALEPHDGGRYYMGCCPIHGDTRPSFSVQPALGIWKCFACQRGGTAVEFLMAVEDITRDEAISRLSNGDEDMNVLALVRERLKEIPERLARPVERVRLTWDEMRERLSAEPWWYHG